MRVPCCCRHFGNPLHGSWTLTLSDLDLFDIVWFGSQGQGGLGAKRPALLVETELLLKRNTAIPEARHFAGPRDDSQNRYEAIAGWLE